MLFYEKLMVKKMDLVIFQFFFDKLVDSCLFSDVIMFFLLMRCLPVRGLPKKCFPHFFESAVCTKKKTSGAKRADAIKYKFSKLK